MVKKLAFIMGILFGVFLLGSLVFPYTTYDMDKKLAQEAKDFSFSVTPEQTYLSLEKGSTAIIKLYIDLKTTTDVEFIYSFNSPFTVVTNPQTITTKYSHYKVINIAVPEDLENKEYKLEINVLAKNQFTSKSETATITIKANDKDNYDIKSNYYNSAPNPVVINWENSVVALGPNNVKEQFSVIVANTGGNSDFVPIFEGDSNCFYITDDYSYVNLAPTFEYKLDFYANYDNNSNCVDTTFNFILVDTHTNKKFELGAEYFAFQKPVVIIPEQTNLANNTSDNTDTNLAATMTNSLSGILGKSTALFSLENRAVTIGLIFAIVLILGYLVFRKGGYLNNSQNITMPQSQEN